MRRRSPAERRDPDYVVIEQIPRNYDRRRRAVVADDCSGSSIDDPLARELPGAAPPGDQAPRSGDLDAPIDDAAERRTFLDSWSLRQLLPEGAHPSVSEPPPSSRAVPR